MKTLYHMTDKDSACWICKEGFKNGDDGFVWLGEIPAKILGVNGRSRILKVILNITQEELSSYAITIEDEEYCHSKTGEWVSVPENEREYAGGVFYAMPADRVNAIGRIVLVTPEERAKLMQG